MDQRAISWAAGVADAGLCIRVQGGLRHRLSFVVGLRCHDARVLKTWCGIVGITPSRQSKGYPIGTMIYSKDQKRVLELLLPYMVREDVQRALKIREEYFNRGRTPEERAALVHLWREVKRVEKTT